MIQYLVDTVEGGKDIVNQKDGGDMYPLHLACYGGASLDVIQYFVETVEGGKETVNQKDGGGKLPLHRACLHGSSLQVVRYLIQQDPECLGVSDHSGCMAVDYLDDDKKKKLFGESKTMAFPDKPSAIDKLGYSTYAKALAKAVRIAETPDSSLCVGLYGPWGSGKSTLTKHIWNYLEAEFRLADAQKLQSANPTSVGSSLRRAKAKVLESSMIDRSTKDVLGQSSKDNAPTSHPPLSFWKWSLVCYLKAKECCRRQSKIDDTNDDRIQSSMENGTLARTLQVKQYRRDERDAIVFSFIVAIFVLTVVPAVGVFISYRFYRVMHRRVKALKEDGEASAKHMDAESGHNDDADKDADDNSVAIESTADGVLGLITGDGIVGREIGDSMNLLNTLVITMLWIIQYGVSGISNILKTLRSWFGCCFVRDESNDERFPS